MKLDKLSVHDVAVEIGIPDATVATRFASKYARERWGVKFDPKTRHRFVYRKDLGLWNRPVGLYRGRPVIKFNK